MISATAARPVGSVGTAGMTTSAPAPVSLLAPPAAPTSEGMDDALSMLYALNAKLDAMDTNHSEKEVVAGTQSKKAELGEERAAMQKQEDARRKQEEESHSFLHDLAKSAGVIGKVLEGVAVAALAVTCPAAAVAVVALSAASFAASQLKAGPLATIANLACIGGEVVTGILTCGTSTVATAASGAASVANGVGTTASVVSNARLANDQADAVDAGADTKAAQQKIALRQALIEDAIAAMKDAHESHSRAMGTIQTTMQIGEATNVGLASFGRV